MKVVKGYPDGLFCWVDLMTSDVGAAKDFYHGLFGWEFDDVPTDIGPVYSMCQIDGKNVAGMGPLSTTARVSEHRFAEAAIGSQTGAPRRAARIAPRGPSGTFDAPRSQGRQVQIPFLARNSDPHRGAAARGHPHRKDCRRVWR